MRIWILSSKIHANCYFTVDHEKPNRTKGNNKKKLQQTIQTVTYHSPELMWRCHFFLHSKRLHEQKKDLRNILSLSIDLKSQPAFKTPNHLLCLVKIVLDQQNCTLYSSYCVYDKEINLIVSITKLRSLMEYGTVPYAHCKA